MAEDFSNLKIPVFSVPENEDIVKYFRELSVLESFYSLPEKDRNKVVKYIVLAYDPYSPCVRNNSSELKKKKDAAAEAAGYKRNPSGKFPDSVLCIMDMSDKLITNAICDYLKYFVNNRLWSLIVVNEQVLSEYITLLMEPVNKGDGDDKKLLEAANTKSKLRDECKSIVSDLDKQYKDLYGENEDLKEVISKPVRPETMI
jgi:hypothetical protein